MQMGTKRKTEPPGRDPDRPRTTGAEMDQMQPAALPTPESQGGTGRASGAGDLG